MMASGKQSKKTPAKKGKPAPVITRKQGVPWLTIGAVAAVVALAAGIFTVVMVRKSEQAALDVFVPTADNKVPAADIQGAFIAERTETESGVINFTKYKSLIHIDSPQRVAYDMFPPIGGPHDGVWAACNGVVYPVAVRDESMVHPLEHGAVWIAYNPETIASGDVAVLEELVRNKPFMVMSPYPGLDRPISVQAWGQQLKVDSASDERVRQFITATLRNPYTYPEIGATCDQPSFNIQMPPAFDASPRGEDAIPLDGGTIEPDVSGQHTEPLDPTEVSGTEASTEVPTDATDSTETAPPATETTVTTPETSETASSEPATSESATTSG